MADDIPLCVDLLAAVHRADGYPMQWPQHPASWLTPSGLLDAWIAEIAGEMVGHVARVGGQPPTMRAAEAQAEVSRLFVSPAARRRGIATQLLDALTHQADREGCALWLEVVEVSTAAIAFYEKLDRRLIDRGPAGWIAAQGRGPWLRRYGRAATVRVPVADPATGSSCPPVTGPAC